MLWPGFIGGSYPTLSVTADQEHLVNMYLERAESPGATARSYLYPMPGVTTLATGTSSPGRGHFFQDGKEYAVQGTSFVEISEGGTVTSRGTVATNSDPATIVSNGDGGGQILVTSGGNAYSYDTASLVFAAIASLAGKATKCAFMDGYGIVLDAATSTAYNSALLDFTSFTTGTDFAQRSAASDRWESLAVAGQYLWFYGSQTSEAWYNAGTSGFPFAKYPSGPIPYGIKAPFSVAVGDGVVMWLGATALGERYVLKASGLSPQVVSDFPRQQTFAGYTEVEDAQADMFTWDGHTFYLLTFPTQNITWVYDLTENVWFQQGTWLSEASAYSAWRPRWHAMAFGEHRMLDAETGGIYKLSSTARTDVDSRAIRVMRRTPGLSHQNRRIIYPGLELELERGIGTATGQGSNPQVMMRVSRDGGRTWGTERTASAGKIGEYSKRVRFNQLGEARHLVCEITATDPIGWKFLNAFLDPDPVGLPRQRRTA